MFHLPERQLRIHIHICDQILQNVALNFVFWASSSDYVFMVLKCNRSGFDIDAYICCQYCQIATSLGTLYGIRSIFHIDSRIFNLWILHIYDENSLPLHYSVKTFVINESLTWVNLLRPSDQQMQQEVKILNCCVLPKPKLKFKEGTHTCLACGIGNV